MSKEFKPNDTYLNPDKVVLFGRKSSGDQHKHVGAIRLRLNPNENELSKYDTIVEAIRNGKIELDLKAQLDMFMGKAFNHKHHYHLPKFVTGFFAMNFDNYPAQTDEKTKTLFGFETLILKQEIEDIKKLYALQYLALVLHMLLYEPAMEITERNYHVEKYYSDERKIVSAPKSAGNNYSYPIVYDREMNFAI